MKNEAKLTIMGNSFPRIHNPTDAFWERILILTFPNQFTGSNQRVQIEKTWLENSEDRSGILNWMIDGAKRLIENNFLFTESKSQKEIIIQFKRASDNIGAFIEEAITLDIKAVTPKADVQKHYTDYCNFIDTQAQSPAKLNAKLLMLKGVKEARSRVGTEKTQVKVWKGFSLKPIIEESDETNENNDVLQMNLTNFETSETSETSFLPKKVFEEENNKDKILVSSVSPVSLLHESSFSECSEGVEGYSQLVCVFCGKAVGDDWVQGDFTWNKPAHKSCYEAKCSELANLDKMGDF